MAGGDYDVVVVGGGAMGAAVFDRLAGAGRRVLLCDGGDFAGGTSQASAMLLWGGLLYAAQREWGEIGRLTRERERWLAGRRRWAEPHGLSYVYGPRPHRDPRAVRAGLWAYWLAGRGRRRPPTGDTTFPEQAFARGVGRLRVEEGRLRVSDAQLVLDWLRPTDRARAVNYCRVAGGAFERGRWTLDMDGGPRVTARWVVNAAGVGADDVNAAFGIASPWRHALAKGVSVCVRRPADHHDTLVFDDRGADEGCSLVPWGPVSLWGSTERAVNAPEWHADAGEVGQLLSSLNRHTRLAVTPADVVSLRCGVRGLVVRRDAADADPLRLSKRWQLHVDPGQPWVTMYGGKITSSPTAAAAVCRLIGRHLGRAEPVARPPLPAADLTAFPGLADPLPTAAWCRRWQACRTLADYLRRRTNIAQWVDRGGLGRHNEHRPTLLAIAAELHDDPTAAVADYERQIEQSHDAVLGTGTVNHA